MYVRFVLFCAVRGYLPSSRDSQQDSMKQISGDQEKLAQLSLLKQSLLLELKNFESNEKVVTTQHKIHVPDPWAATALFAYIRTYIQTCLKTDSTISICMYIRTCRVLYHLFSNICALFMCVLHTYVARNVGAISLPLFSCDPYLLQQL